MNFNSLSLPSRESPPPLPNFNSLSLLSRESPPPLPPASALDMPCAPPDSYEVDVADIHVRTRTRTWSHREAGEARRKAVASLAFALDAAAGRPRRRGSAVDEDPTDADEQARLLDWDSVALEAGNSF